MWERNEYELVLQNGWVSSLYIGRMPSGGCHLQWAILSLASFLHTKQGQSAIRAHRMSADAVQGLQIIDGGDNHTLN